MDPTPTPAADLAAALQGLSPEQIKAFGVSCWEYTYRAAPMHTGLPPIATVRTPAQALVYAHRAASAYAGFIQDSTRGIPNDDPTIFWDALRTEQDRQLAYARTLAATVPIGGGT